LSPARDLFQLPSTLQRKNYQFIIYLI
jgi:hypothetical protein